MLLKQQLKNDDTCYEAEAFAATVIVFKIRLTELQMAAGVSKMTIERLKLGYSELSTEDLGKIVYALTPSERNFYNSMIQVQRAATDGNIRLPLLEFSRQIERRSDIYRDALELTLNVFCLQQKYVYTRAGIQASNFSAWLKGTRDISLSNLSKIKGALSREQRTFMEAIGDALIALEPLPYPAKKTESSKQLNIA